MPKSMRIILNIIFVLSIMLIVISIFSLTVARSVNLEFADYEFSSKFYHLIMQGFPLAVLLTLSRTIRMPVKQSINIFIVVGTIICSIITLILMFLMMFSVGFNTITNDTLLYKYKSDTSITIVAQSIGQGILGEDGHRIVLLEPFMKYWNNVSIIDTSRIELNDWVKVNKPMRKNENTN